MLIPLDAADTFILTTPELKAQLKVQHTSDDALIEDYRASATALVGRLAEVVLAPTTFEQRLDCWPIGCVVIETGPVREVDSIVYIDADGAEQAVDDAHWRWEPTRGGAEVWFLSAFTRPAVQTERRGAVRILFTAGYNEPDATAGDPRLTLPAEARQAVRMLVMHWYANREPVVLGATVESVPFAVETLIDALRVYRS
jgi:uncharacterized phiE125 gp8 family phage protein